MKAKTVIPTNTCNGDLTVKYSFTDSWLVYSEISNLGDRPEYYYSGRYNRALQYDEFGTTAAIGVQYNFR